MRLIYNRKYSMIDYNMSDSNIGARKNKSCRNHIWIINGINHEQNSSKKKSKLVFQSYDFTQMFDSMSLDIIISDIYDCGVKDDLLVLLYEANKNIHMSVSTCYGLTEAVKIPALVAQGDLFAPLPAAVQVDSMTRKLEEQDRARVEEGQPGLLFRYKGIIPIPSLGLMDDTLSVSEAGVNAEEINTFMNENSAEKRLQFNPKKCKYLDIGRNTETSVLHNTLEVDTWDISYDEKENMIETEGPKVKMTKVNQLKHLGFVISEDASNVPNISEKKKKSIGIIRGIMNTIKGLGTYTIKNGVIYLNSLLRGSILYAAETYYNLSVKEILEVLRA